MERFQNLWSPDNEIISERGEDGVGGGGLGGDDLGEEGAWKEVGLLQSLCQSPFQLSARTGSSSSSRSRSPSSSSSPRPPTSSPPDTMDRVPTPAFGKPAHAHHVLALFSSSQHHHHHCHHLSYVYIAINIISYSVITIGGTLSVKYLISAPITSTTKRWRTWIIVSWCWDTIVLIHPVTR